MGIGNVLRHEYHRISATVIPPLRAAVSAMEQDLDEG
jgi:hypothetical protein